MQLTSLLDGVKWYPFLFDTPLNTVRSVAIWLTLALLVAYFVAYLVCTFALKTEKRKTFFSRSVPIVIAYVCVLCALYLFLSFQEDGIELILFLPLLALLLCIAASAVASLSKAKNTILYTLYSATAAAFVAVLICMGIHFASGNAAEKNWLTNEQVESLALILCSVIAIALLLFIAFIKGKNEPKEQNSRSITYAAVCIAMSFALSFLRIVRLPQGGSITPASLLPLMVYAYMFGVKKGVFAGFTYGLLQSIQDPTVLHPAQFLLDYPVAFACMGLAGLFANTRSLDKYPQLQFAFGGVLAGIGRFVMHFLSGTFAFAAFAPEGVPAALYSLIYQAGYVLPDIAIAIVCGVALFSSKAFVKESKKFHAPLYQEKGV